MISALQRILGATSCEIRTDNLTRQLYATDASIYQIVPQAVALVKSPAETAEVTRLAAEAGIPVTYRGAGTGLAGGALGSGLIVDLACYNRQISDFDRERRTVRVGAGVILDDVNEYLRPHGLWFGPDVATSSRATLGGMIANNSSGARAPFYGTTSDHIASVEVVLADGKILSLQGEHANNQRGRGGEGARGRSESLQSAADAIVARYAPYIHEHLPPGLVKRWPGYAFDRYLRHPGDLTQLIGASEGTLAGITSAELNLVPLPKERGLGLIFFASVADAMQATVELLDLRPAAIEHVDRILFDQTRGQLAFAAARSLLALDEQPCEAFLIVEFFDEVPGKLAALASRRLGLRTLICRTPAEQALVWGLRKQGLTLLTSRKGPAKPIAGIEDVAIRPEHLPAYVADLRRILRPLGVEASFYGHAASGLLHVRPVLDLHTAEGIAAYRKICDEVLALVRQYKGSPCGEHGVGIARTEYLAAQLGPELMQASRELKAAFDPKNVLNPGKIIPDGRYRIDTNLRQGAGHHIPLPFAPALGFVERDGSFIGNLEQCNGNGMCLKSVPAMCPTYIATHEEIMSTRGRANTIRAVLEGRAGNGHRDDDGHLRPHHDPHDHGGHGLASPDLEAALGPCLSCKACKSECPSNVDMALLKADLLHARHKQHGTPLVDRMIAAADRLGRLGCAMPSLANSLLNAAPVRALMERFLGIAAERQLPQYASERFDRWFATQHSPLSTATAKPLGEAGQHSVLLWDDTWVRYHEPNIGIAAVRVLEAAGCRVLLPEGRECCGRPAFSRGLLDQAARLGRHNLDLLERKYPGLPIIFLEPSCHAMFIDEYRQLRLPNADAVARRAVLFEQFVWDLLQNSTGVTNVNVAHLFRGGAAMIRERYSAGAMELPATAPAADPPDPPLGKGGPQASALSTQHSVLSTELSVAIHAHCHAKALTNVSILTSLAEIIRGVSAALLNSGCCGMAGAYGMMRKNYELSLQVAEPLIARIKALPPGSLVVADGTSCRHQIADLAGIRPLHMAELLAAALPKKTES